MGGLDAGKHTLLIILGTLVSDTAGDVTDEGLCGADAFDVDSA